MDKPKRTKTDTDSYLVDQRTDVAGKNEPVSLSERLPEFKHLETGDRVKVAFFDYQTREDEAYSLRISADCVDLYGASSDDILGSDDPESLEECGASKPEEILDCQQTDGI